MATWSSFEKDKLLAEGWRKFLQEEDRVVFGLNSDDNPDSLKMILADVVDEDIRDKIITLIAVAAENESVVLEAVSLQGSKSEQDRVFSSKTTREILQGIAKLSLGHQKQKAVVKALNYWGRVNTVKFEKPAAASPAAPVEVPDEEPQAAPEAEAAPEAAAAEPPAEVASDPVYTMSDVFDNIYRNTLYSSWKAKRGNRDKSENTFNNDLKTFVDFVAPFLPSHYINEAFKIETLFDRGEFFSKKQQMTHAYNEKDDTTKKAIKRIYTATQQEAATKLNILLHIFKKIKKKE
jgi:hypothetical protein